MDEEENFTFYQKKPPFSYVSFLRCIIKTRVVLVQSHQLLTFLSSPLVRGHIYM